MKRALPILLITVWFALACDLASLSQSTGAKSGSNSLIAQVTLAESIRGVEKDPIGKTTVFKPTSVFHAVVAIKDAPAETKFKAGWFTVDVGAAAQPNTLIDETELVASGTRNIDFSLTPTSMWPKGTYRVEISINDTLDQTLEFSVN